MACHPSPSCEVALEEATVLWPNRRVSSDGICASSSHTAQNPNSDHEPNIVINGRGYATAFDLSDDKPRGCDADHLVELLRQRRDPRIKYVIAEYRMFSSYNTSTHPAWTWRPYPGTNPHSTHVHVSIKPEFMFDTSPWWGPLLEDDDMAWSPQDSANLAEAVKLLQNINHHISGAAVDGARLPTLMQDVDRMADKIVGKD